MQKREPPTLRPQKPIEVLSQYSLEVKFLRGKSMTVSDFYLDSRQGLGFAK